MREVAEIFDSAIALTATERQAFLDSRCAGDPDLRAVVERLLRADEANAVSDPIAGAIRDAAGDVEVARSRSDGARRFDRKDDWNRLVTRLADATAGRYRIERLLGFGGMAGVFLAEELRLQRKVAIKVVSPAVTLDPGSVERFWREARMTAGLDHPNVVSIFDVGEADGLHYFAMEYVDGCTLADLLLSLRGLWLPIDLVMHWMAQVGGALERAHQNGVIHRDVKAANVMIDRRGDARVTDFGIAKATGESAGLTRSGLLIGTPRYMSPEQAAGLPITAATDQYALGVLTFELLAGEPPFTGGMMAVIESHRSRVAPRVAGRRPDAPAEAAATVGRMLEKSPEGRFRSVAGAVSAMEARVLPLEHSHRDWIASLIESLVDDEVDERSRLEIIGERRVLSPGDSRRFAVREPGDGASTSPNAIAGDVWRSSDPRVVTVDDDGTVSALRPGAATISATRRDRTASTLINVVGESAAHAGDRAALPPAGADVAPAAPAEARSPALEPVSTGRGRIGSKAARSYRRPARILAAVAVVAVAGVATVRFAGGRGGGEDAIAPSPGIVDSAQPASVATALPGVPSTETAVEAPPESVAAATLPVTRLETAPLPGATGGNAASAAIAAPRQSVTADPIAPEPAATPEARSLGSPPVDAAIGGSAPATTSPESAAGSREPPNAGGGPDAEPASPRSAIEAQVQTLIEGFVDLFERRDMRQILAAHPGAAGDWLSQWDRLLSDDRNVAEFRASATTVDLGGLAASGGHVNFDLRISFRGVSGQVEQTISIEAMVVANPSGGWSIAGLRAAL